MTTKTQEYIQLAGRIYIGGANHLYMDPGLLFENEAHFLEASYRYSDKAGMPRMGPGAVRSLLRSGVLRRRYARDQGVLSDVPPPREQTTPPTFGDVGEGPDGTLVSNEARNTPNVKFGFHPANLQGKDLPELLSIIQGQVPDFFETEGEPESVQEAVAILTSNHIG